MTVLAPNWARAQLGSHPVERTPMTDTETQRPLTENQAKALRFIIEFIQGNGAPPAWSQIARHIGTGSRNPDIVSRLIKYGYLARLPIRYRNITITESGRKWYEQVKQNEAQGSLPL